MRCSRMRDRIATIGPIAAVAGALGLCCGLPVLLSLGVLSAGAGLSLQNWALVGVGLVLALVGWAWWARRRRAPEDATHQETPNAATGNGP